jgi:hypothetical protein
VDYSPKIFGIPIEIAFAMFSLLVAVNLVFLDVVIMGKRSETGAASVIIQSNPSTVAAACPSACLSKIQELATSPATLVTQLSPSNTPTSTPVPTKAPSTASELFVPFGSGSGSSTDWQDIPGLVATIDSANYSKNKTVTFEVSLRIPTGNQTVYARLFNATDKHPVWFSDVSLEGGTPNLVISSPVTLDSGNKTYQVQLMTSLGFLSFIDQSRLHIITR